ncbi:MAG: aldo/keto reductase [Sphingomicrobium sp.]
MNLQHQIGRTQVRVPPLGFGAAVIGNLYIPIDEQTACEAVLAALAGGLTYFDTAPHYGFGLSESRIGAALSEADAAQTAIVSTKVGRLLVPVAEELASAERHGFVNAAPYEPLFDYGYDAVLRSFEGSCARLRRERIDILYVHDLGRVTHGGDHERQFASFMNGGYRAMRELRDAGSVGAIGIGANEWKVCEEAMGAGEFDLFLLAGRYTLLEQSALESFLPECGRRNISVVVGGPYNSGILAQGTGSGGTLHYNYAPAPPEIVHRVRRLEDVCQRHGVPLAAAALQFPLRHPQVAAVIPGLGSAAQVQDTCALYQTWIPDALWSELKHAGLLHPDAPVGELAQ